jgi:hypothetical protein
MERIRDVSARVTPRMLQRLRSGWERPIRMCCQCNGAHVERVFVNIPFSPCMETS